MPAPRCFAGGWLALVFTLTLCSTAGGAMPAPLTRNNFVTELLAAGPSNALPVEPYGFANSRPGWVFVQVAGVVAEGEMALVCLDAPDRVLLRLEPGAGRAETMRWLPAGEHELLLAPSGGARLSSLVVRAVPELIYANYPSDPHVAEYGKYDWAFLRRAGLLDSATTLITGADEGTWLDEWTGRGRHVIQQVGVPGINEGDRVTADQAYDYWAKSRGMTDPRFSGVIADEFWTGHHVPKYPAWTAAIKRLAAERPGHLFYPYLGGELAGFQSFVEPLIPAGCLFGVERYLKEQPTEAQARSFIARELKDDLVAAQAVMPGLARHLIYVLGILSAPPESLDTNPAVSYKVFLDMQFHLLATDPALAGLAGVELYLSSYADEEYLRWAAALYRHYCIEGSTERLSADPYLLPHLQNPDFEQGLAGWTVKAAEPGSVDTKQMQGYGWLQGRYPEDEQGDTFLWLHRSAQGPNVVSQTIRDLQPGRAYCLKLYVGDYAQLTRQQRHPLRVELAGADPVPERSFQATYPNCYSHHIERFGDQQTYHGYIRQVFRARSTTAGLTISDWLTKTDPGGPLGQELMVNFVQVEPYYEG